MRKSIVLWVIAVLVTLASAVWQRMTGPTYPVRFTRTVGEATVGGKLLRTQTAGQELPVTLRVETGTDVSGTIVWRRFPTGEAWREVTLQREGDRLTGGLPGQAAAGKVEYYVRVAADGETVRVPAAEAAVARFKGHVPLAVLLIHVLVMFLGMLWSLRGGLEALAGGPRLPQMARVTAVLLACGGLVLGPIVQKYAFDVYWSGWPLGEDLTDNKLAVAVLAWAVAVWRLRGYRADDRRGRSWAVAAMLVTFIIFMIPHSLHGSTLDYDSGEQYHTRRHSPMPNPQLCTVSGAGSSMRSARRSTQA